MEQPCICRACAVKIRRPVGDRMNVHASSNMAQRQATGDNTRVSIFWVFLLDSNHTYGPTVTENF